MSNREEESTKIAVIGAGWWSQGWHIPQLERNGVLAAIVDHSKFPTSNLNPNLEPLETLGTKYNVPIFTSVEDLLEDRDVGHSLDGILVATPHATHYKLGATLLAEAQKRMQNGQKPLHILMEKPVTTDVEEAKKLHDLVENYKMAGGVGTFFINHSANYRPQTKKAREIISAGIIGDIRHVSASFASPLLWIFNDPANTGWNEPTGSMKGNGFAWGQSSHLLGWIYHVCPTLVPQKVFCMMNHSEATGADVSHAASIVCRSARTKQSDVYEDFDGNNESNNKSNDNNIVMSISGTTLLPGNAHSEPPVGKLVDIKIYGSKGSLMYCGDDRDRGSGSLVLRGEDGRVQKPCGDGFDFENTESEGLGPESLQNFILACQGKDDFYHGADSLLGLRTVQTLEAFYRSNDSKQVEVVHFHAI